MFKKLVVAGVLMSSFGFAQVAQASSHGCEVLLCMANPRGPMALGECVPPIKRLFRDLARGRAFPTCSFSSGSGASAGTSSANYATNRAAGPRFCHPDYLVEIRGRTRCTMKGAVTVYVEGVQKNRVWWDENGNSVTEDPI